jgi:actin-related protein
MMGLDQAGLAECISLVASRLSEAEKQIVLSRFFLTGGLSKLKGFRERFEKEIRYVVSFEQDFTILRAADPSSDSWNGAAYFARTLDFKTRQYDVDQLMQHNCSNDFFPHN